MTESLFETIRNKLIRRIQNIVGPIDHSCQLSYWYKTSDGQYAFIYSYRGQDIKVFFSKEEGEIWSMYIEEYERKIKDEPLSTSIRCD